MNRVLATLFALVAISGPGLAAEKRLDAWFEEPLLPVLAKPGGEIVSDWDRKAISLDYADKKNGDFSLLYTAPAAKEPPAIGLTPGPYLKTWSLGADWSLHLWLKAAPTEPVKEWPLALVDAAGTRAEGALKGFAADGQWRQVKVPLKDLKAADGFDFKNVAGVRIDAGLPVGTRLWLDDVYFTDGKQDIGVTDKTIAQRMAEAKATRAQRVDEVARKDREMQVAVPFWPTLADLDAAQTSADIAQKWSAEADKIRQNPEKPWGSIAGPLALIDCYFNYAAPDAPWAGKLSNEAKAAILDYLWQYTQESNDIALARESSWWIAHSENLDMNHKTVSLLTSRIFINEPDYANRIYPDRGQGYWNGRGRMADGKKHNAKDHYEAWVEFYNRYLTDRAKRGFFLERGAAGYSGSTLRNVFALYLCGGDETLKKRARMFLDLYFADWAQNQVAGIRGGTKFRYSPGDTGPDAVTPLAVFLLGGPCAADNYRGRHHELALGDYELPRPIWELALDREGLGVFKYVGRGLGEENPTLPRPRGTEFTMRLDTEHRMVRYSWVTPDYILGSQMDHPGATLCHLAMRRWQGLIVPSTQAVICPMRLVNCVQHNEVLIAQANLRTNVVNPDWFPSGGYKDGIAVYINKNWERVEEKEGWVFAQSANAYAAVRIIDAVPDPQKKPGPGDPKGAEPLILRKDTYAWDQPAPGAKKAGGTPAPPADWSVASPAGSGKRSNQISTRNGNVVIIEAGRRADYPTLEAFQKAILANKLHAYKQSFAYYLVYKGAGKDAKEILYNMENPADVPSIGGELVTYSCPKTFDSPYLSSDYDSGVVTIQCGGRKLVLDFNKAVVQDVGE